MDKNKLDMIELNRPLYEKLETIERHTKTTAVYAGWILVLMILSIVLSMISAIFGLLFGAMFI